jgi:hypothetical protein
MLHNDVALERLRYQGNDLCSNLATLISALREARYNQDGREELDVCTKIEELILKRTGIGLNLEIVETSDMNAWVYIRDDAKFYRHTYNYTELEKVAKDHPFIVTDWRKTNTTWIDGKPVEFEVDYNNSYIDFKDKRLSDHLHNAAITSGLTENNNITDYEISAILLHELGHVFHYYAMCGILQHTSYVMHVALESLANKVPEKDRIVLVTDACKKAGIPTEYVGGFCDVRSPAGVVTVLDIASKAKMQSVMNVKHYNNRFEEMMADNFAMMHGAGAAIATALKKMREGHTNHFYFIANRGNHGMGMTALFFALEILFFYGVIFVTLIATTSISNLASMLGVVGAIGGAIFYQLMLGFTVTFILATFLSSLSEDVVYDRTYERVKSMRRSLIQSLRTVEDKAYTERIINDLDALTDALSNHVKTRYTSAFVIPAEIIVRMSGKNRNMDFIRELEDAVGNELHVESKRLGTLA